MNTIVCVLKSGVFKPWGHKDYTVEYRPRHVQWLRDQFASHIKTPHRFVCMTDVDIPGVETLPLQDNLPGWWSKLEIFREFTNAAYVDLDTVVLNDVSKYLFSSKPFLMSEHLTRRHGVNSSVMSWNSDLRFLYDEFIANKEQIMKEFVFARRWGDQDFIKETYMAKRGQVVKFQHIGMKFILSYKHDILNHGMPLRVGSRRRMKLGQDWLHHPWLITFHGKPKPYQVEAPWIPKLCAA